MNLLGRHLTGLADFAGRENRQQFWLWILIVYAVQFVVGLVVMTSITMSMMAPIMQGDPHRFDDRPELAQQMIAQTIMPMMSDIMIWVIVSAVVMPVLYLGVMPAFFEKFATIRPGMTPDQVNAQMAPMMQSFGWLSLLGMVSFLMTIVLIVFLALPGTQGPNRYGEDPLALR